MSLQKFPTMKNTIITLASVATLSGSAYAQTVDWNVNSYSAGISKGDILLGGADIGDFTLQIDNLSSATTSTAIGGSDLHGRFRGPSSGSASADYTLGITLDPTYTVSGLVMNSVGTTFDLANPIYKSISFNGAPNATISDGTTLSGLDYFNGLANGDLISSGDTLTSNIGANSTVGWVNGTTDQWAVNFGAGTTKVGFTYITDGNVNTSNEEVIFDLNVTPVPEPSSTALLGLGALGLLVRRKR